MTVAVSLRNQGGSLPGGVQNIAVACQGDDAVVSGCPEAVVVELPNGPGAAETEFTIRAPMGTNSLAVSFSTDGGLSDTVEVNVPERILGIDRHVWECYSGRPNPMTRCGGWFGRLGIDAVYKWEPGKPIGVWATGPQDHLAALDGILDQISELMNHTFVMAGSKEQANLVVGLGISSFPGSCIGGSGCGRAFREDGGDLNTAAGGEAYVRDYGDVIPRRIIAHELMHALIPQGHYPMAYHTVGEIQNLAAGDEAILRLHAHPLVQPGMTLEQMEQLLVFRDELLDASPTEVNTLVWRARETLFNEQTVSFDARGTCLAEQNVCQSHGVQEFDWTEYNIGELKLPGNHLQDLSLQNGDLEAYVAGKEFWINTSNNWRSMDWLEFSAATQWRPNYTSLFTVLENILLLAHEDDISVTEAEGQIVLETRQNRELRLISNLGMDVSLTLDSTTFRVSDYTVTICLPEQSAGCIFQLEARQGAYGVDLTIPETIRQSTPTPAPWEGLAEVATLSSGVFHTCALREDGTPVCWGNNDSGQAAPPRGEQFASISSGGDYTCGLRQGGTPLCWGSAGLFGSDNHWRSRDGLWTSPTDANREVGYNAKALTIMRFKSLSAGTVKACAIQANGTPRCWGRDDVAPTGETFIAISSGESHTCALREDGAPVCWGRDDSIQPPEGERFVSISSGARYTCALREDGTPVCWGKQGYVPLPPEGERFSSISSGWHHVCALRQDGTPFCWGSETSQLEGERFASISSGAYHTCALRLDGSVLCWGSNSYGRASPPQGERFAVR